MGSWEQQQRQDLLFCSNNNNDETMCYFPQTATGSTVQGSIHQSMMLTNISLPVISLELICHRFVFCIIHSFPVQRYILHQVESQLIEVYGSADVVAQM